MQLFRKLAGNIFFKIILAFVALTFVLFGVSGFILGSPNSWVVKVGGTTIGSNALSKAMQTDREIILASAKSDEALQYLDSDRFKSDVLGRLVNKVMIEELHDDFGVSASRKLILSAVATDPSFKNQDGKFDREVFKKFLAKNGLNEERYVNEIANDITATMIIQTIALAAPINNSAVLATENFKQEKRVADVATISIKNIDNVAKPSDDEVEKFFAENKKSYSLPEMRKVSYLYFAKKDFDKDLQISDAELTAEYEKNKDQLKRPESRDFYHVLFAKSEEAKSFLDKFDAAAKADKSKAKDQFAKLAKEIEKKDLKAITLAKFTHKDLIPELSEPAFKLAVNERSEVLQSPLGFHIFLPIAIHASEHISFAEAKASIKQQMAQGRAEKVLQTKIAAIDDAILTSNSLTEVAKKFNLKVGSAVTIDQAGQNSKGEAVDEIKNFSDFSTNAFALKKDQASKIFYSKNFDGFYALKLEEIKAAHESELAQVKSRVVEDLLKSKKQEVLLKLAKKVGEEIKNNPSSAAQIAAKYKIKFEKNREFPRVYYINFQGRQMAYPSKFLDELFAIKVGQSTPALLGQTQEFTVGVLREIKSAQISSAQFAQAQKQASESFKGEILQAFNGFILKKHPVKVNEKILGKKAE